MKLIPLTRGYFTKVDDEDFIDVASKRWHASISSNAVRASRSETIDGKSRHVFLSRYIMKPPRDKYVDHINGDTLDNRRCNLRICTAQENNRNSIKKRVNTSGYKGVHWNKHSQKWTASICLNSKSIHLGSFTEVEEAVKAYNVAAKKYFGEFAKLVEFIPQI